VSVDDELVFTWQGDEVFAKSFSQNGQPVQPEVVEIPRQTLTPLTGETVTVIYRDVYSAWVSATPLWLIHVPAGGNR
jgi:hypothetical protein